MTFCPFTEETFDQMIESCAMPDGSRANVHIYVLTPCDYMDMGASRRARLHNRRPVCQNCLCELADNDVDDRVLCGRPGCDNPDAILIWDELGDGEGQVDDVAAGGNAAASSPTSPVPGDCLLYTSPSPRDVEESRMPSSA